MSKSSVQTKITRIDSLVGMLKDWDTINLVRAISDALKELVQWVSSVEHNND